MSNKFVSASIWNFIANFSMRVLSLVTYPFIVRNFTKGDISIFKAIQSLIAILIATIPFGTKHLFISSAKEKNRERWNVTFYISVITTLVLIIFVNLNKELIASFLGKEFKFINNYIYSLIIFTSFIKSLLLISLMKKIDFKSISLSLMVKQFIFYLTIIIFSLLPYKKNVLIIILLLSEILEILLLTYFSIRKRVRFFPYKNLGLKIDKISKRFLLFMGSERVFSILALHLPSIFVIYVMGKKMAPEFQLPFYAISVPASLIMFSVARVIFPYMSKLKENYLMRKTFLSVEFVLTLLIIPILIIISLFNHEIVSIIFEKGWDNATFAVRYFPIMIFVNVLNNPFTSIAAIKHKPHITLIYSISLFLGRMFAIYFGFIIGGFKLAILLFISLDVIIRLIRLRVDLSLIELRVKDFISNIRYNLITGALLFIAYFTINTVVGNKIVSILISLILWMAAIYYFEKTRIKKLIAKVLKR